MQSRKSAKMRIKDAQKMSTMNWKVVEKKIKECLVGDDTLTIANSDLIAVVTNDPNMALMCLEKLQYSNQLTADRVESLDGVLAAACCHETQLESRKALVKALIEAGVKPNERAIRNDKTNLLRVYICYPNPLYIKDQA